MKYSLRKTSPGLTMREVADIKTRRRKENMKTLKPTEESFSDTAKANRQEAVELFISALNAQNLCGTTGRDLAGDIIEGAERLMDYILNDKKPISCVPEER